MLCPDTLATFLLAVILYPQLFSEFRQLALKHIKNTQTIIGKRVLILTRRVLFEFFVILCTRL